MHARTAHTPPALTYSRFPRLKDLKYSQRPSTFSLINLSSVFALAVAARIRTVLFYPLYLRVSHPDHYLLRSASRQSRRALSSASVSRDSKRVEMPAERQNEYFIPGDGIMREVIHADICYYVGDDALVRPGNYQGRQGYFLRAYRNLTSVSYIETITVSRETNQYSIENDI
jgi:hypothetical protein